MAREEGAGLMAKAAEVDWSRRVTLTLAREQGRCVCEGCRVCTGVPGYPCGGPGVEGGKCGGCAPGHPQVAECGCPVHRGLKG
jgi:hypothetical protein